MPDRKKQRDGTIIVRARPFDRRPDAKPKRPVIGTFPNTTKGWKAAERAEGAWYEENRPDAQIRVAKLREEYLADHASRWDVLSTQRARERSRAFSERYGAEPAESIRPDTCRRWLAAHKSDRQALRAMWAWAVKADMLVANPWDKLGASGSAKARRQEIIVPGRGALTEDELASFCAYAADVHGDWLGSMVGFTGYSGLRQGEVFAARPDWISGDLLEVSQQYRSRAPEGERWTLPKYGKVRTLALLEEAAEALERGERRGPFLFANPRDGSHWTAPAFAYYWNATAAAWSASQDAPRWLRERHRMVKANRTDRRGATGALTFHELRHTFATILLEDGVIHDQVALQLGDTVEQVYDTYGHPRSIAAALSVQHARAAAKARRAGSVTSLEEARARRAG
jgi:integrase